MKKKERIQEEERMTATDHLPVATDLGYHSAAGYPLQLDSNAKRRHTPNEETDNKRLPSATNGETDAKRFNTSPA